MIERGDRWITDELMPRVLIVEGRSAIDHDCLVARDATGIKNYWIVDGGGKTKNCFVTGLGVRASKVTP